MDSSGYVYVAGGSESPNFPTTTGAFDSALGGQRDAFVAKIDPSQSGVASLIYSTFLGGSGFDQATAIAVDAAANVFLTGETRSTDFPTVGAFHAASAGGPNGSDAFVTKLSPAGDALIYSTYLGGQGDDRAFGIAVDAVGNAHVAGDTTNQFGVDFPTTPNAFQVLRPSILSTSADCFVTKLNATGNSLLYSTFLGGGGGDGCQALALHTAGHIYVTGITASPDFPTLNGFQTAFNGGIADAFVAKIDPSGVGPTSLLYATYLGGSDDDRGNGISVDPAGNAYVVGFTTSVNFPITVDAFQPTYRGSGDALVTKIDPTQTGTASLVYSTYLGGTSEDYGGAIAVDSTGNAYVTGGTISSDFPTQNAFGPTGSTGLFVTKFDVSGSAIAWSSSFGFGSSVDRGKAITLDGSGNIYLAAEVHSAASYPLINSYQSTPGGTFDAFVVKLGVGADLSLTKSDSPDPVTVGSDLTYTITVTNNGPDQATGATVTDTLPGSVTFVGTTSSQGTCTYSVGTVTCNLGSLANAGTATVTIVVSPTTPGTINNTVSVTAAEFDQSPTNNTATQATTVNPAGTPVASLGPANIWVGLANSDDVGIRFDLRAEVYRNGTELVGAGDLASAPGGSSGFNNAIEHAISLTPVAGARFFAGDTLSIRLLVRNACVGSGKTSGRARLWFNDSAANSRFDATINSATTYVTPRVSPSGA